MMDMFSPEHIHHNFTSLSHKVTIEQKSVCLCDIYLWKKILLPFFFPISDKGFKVSRITAVSTFLFAVISLSGIFIDSKLS